MSQASAAHRRSRGIMPVAGLAFLLTMLTLCLGSLPYTLSRDSASSAVPRYNAGSADAARLPPRGISPSRDQASRLNRLVDPAVAGDIAARHHVPIEVFGDPLGEVPAAAQAELRTHWPRWALGTDVLGRSLLLRLLTGGGISLVVGLVSALISVVVGTLYGAMAGWFGGRIDAVMMRIVDVLYGLPYVLLVVLLAVASEAIVEEFASRSRARERWIAQMTEVAVEAGVRAKGLTREAVLASPAESLPELALVERTLRATTTVANPAPISSGSVQEAIHAMGELAVPRRAIAPGTRTLLDLGTLLVAIGGVSWLTMARVIRGQVLSLKARPFIEAARAMGASPARIFLRHLLPNLVGPIVVYATLTVPQAILQESFLSFLGIGVKPPLPSWGTLASDGLSELNPYQSNWWLLVFPCLLLGLTLLAMNFLGEGLRARLDPRSK